MKKQTEAQIEWLNPKELLDNPFDPRSAKNRKDSTKELRAQVDALGRIDETKHVCQYVERDGKKYVTNGQTIRDVAIERGDKKVPCIRAEMDDAEIIINNFHANSGRKLDMYEQGKQFIALRDGEQEVSDYTPSDSSEKERVTKFIRQPMAVKDIAARVGCGVQHVYSCILLNEIKDERIHRMITDDEVSPSAVLTAQKGVNNEKTLLAILFDAINEARVTDNVTRATEKHVKAVKEKHVEPKKLKAAKKGDETPAGEPKGKSSHSESSGGEKPSSDDSHAKGDSSGAQGELLSAPETPAKSKKTVMEEIEGIITFISSERDLELDDSDVSAIAKAIVSAGIPF